MGLGDEGEVEVKNVDDGDGCLLCRCNFSERCCFLRLHEYANGCVLEEPRPTGSDLRRCVHVSSGRSARRYDIREHQCYDPNKDR